MTSPLREMTAAASRMATGDYSQRVSATSADEVGTLGAAFNTMAADLADADRQRRQLVRPCRTSCAPPSRPSRPCSRTSSTGSCAPTTTSCAPRWPRAERLSTLVGDLLDLSRVDGGARRLRLAEVGSGTCCATGSRRPVGGRRGAVSPQTHPADLEVSPTPARLAPARRQPRRQRGCGTARPEARCGSSPAASGDDPGGSRSATRVPASRPTAWTGSSTGSGPAATTPGRHRARPGHRELGLRAARRLITAVPADPPGAGRTTARRPAAARRAPAVPTRPRRRGPLRRSHDTAGECVRSTTSAVSRRPPTTILIQPATVAQEALVPGPMRRSSRRPRTRYALDDGHTARHDGVRWRARRGTETGARLDLR